MPDYTDLARRLRESHPLDLSQEDRNRAADALDAMGQQDRTDFRAVEAASYAKAARIADGMDFYGDGAIGDAIRALALAKEPTR